MTVKLAKPFEVGDNFISSIPEPDPSTLEIEFEPPTQILGGSYTGAYSSSADGGDGFVYCFGNTGKVLKINTSNNTFTEFGSYIGTYRASVLVGDKIYSVGSSGEVLVLDILTQSLSTFGSFTSSYYSAVLANDGFIYCVGTVPLGGSSTVLRINPANNSISMIGSYNSNYYTSSLANDGNIYCVGAAENVLLINPISLSVSTFGSVVAGGGAFFASSLSSDGNIYCAGWLTGAALEINPLTSEASSFGSLSGQFYAAATSKSGSVCFVGKDETIEVQPYTRLIEKISEREGDFFAAALAANSSIYCSGGLTGAAGGKVMRVRQPYFQGESAIKQLNHMRYSATTTTRDDPELGASKIPPTWVAVGPTNKYAMFDASTSQKSFFGSGAKQVVLNDVPLSNALGLFAISGIDSVTLTVKDQGGATLHTETKSTLDQSGAFNDLSVSDLLFEYPPFSDTDITVSFTGSDMYVGAVAVGLAEEIGTAVAGTALGDTDYSTLEYDEFGNTKYIERPIVPYHTFQVDVDKAFAMAVARKIQSVRGVNAVWIADIGEAESLVALGRCERSPITYDNPSLVSYSIKVRGTA